MHEPTVTLELAKRHGLLEEEYEAILRILGRTPTYTELGIFQSCGQSTAVTKIPLRC